jgi:hypothetical protein
MKGPDVIDVLDRLEAAGNPLLGRRRLGRRRACRHPDSEGLGAIGVIEGRTVPCLTAELQLRHHLGYPWDEHDRDDIRALAERSA